MLQVFLLQRKQYIRMAKVFPLANYTGWKPNPHTYRKVVASSEVTCGVIFTVIPGCFSIAVEQISHVASNPFCGVSDQVRHKPGCTTTEDG